jgi:hypothetical protein
MLHDPHTIPEPILVLSGTAYLFPAYLAYRISASYQMWSYLFLTGTTMGFHGTRNETLFHLDCIAILNFIGCSLLESYGSSSYAGRLFAASLAYSLTSYFIGRQYRIMSFHPDWNTQMAYHAAMHLSTAYSAHVFMSERSGKLMLE